MSKNLSKYFSILMIIALVPAQSWGTDYFTQDIVGALQVKKTESKSKAATAVSSRSERKVAGLGSLLKQWVEALVRVLRRVKVKSAPTVANVERIVIQKAQSKIPALHGKKYKSAQEMYDDVAKLDNAHEIEKAAIRRSIKEIADEFGVEVKYILEAADQVAHANRLENLVPSAEAIPKFDIKNTESMAGNITNDLRTQSASGKKYIFVIDGSPDELIRAKDTEGKDIFIEGRELLSKQGVFSGYNHVIKLKSHELGFLDPATQKAFKDWIEKVYAVNHPEMNIRSIEQVKRAPMDVRLNMIDQFSKDMTARTQRVAVLVEDAHMIVGNPNMANDGAYYDRNATSQILDWMSESPATLNGKKTGHFTSFLVTNESYKLAPDIIKQANLGRVSFTSASAADRAIYLKQLAEKPEYRNAMPEGMTIDEFADETGGMSLIETRIMLDDAIAAGKKVTMNDLLQNVKKSIENRFAKYTKGENAMVKVTIVDDAQLGRIEAVERSNPEQIKFLDSKFDEFEKTGKLDEAGSKAVLLIGEFGSGKTGIAMRTAYRRKSIVITFERYGTEFHGSKPKFAADAKEVLFNVRNAIAFFDEAHGIPATRDITGSNDMITEDGNAAAAIWAMIFSEAPVKKNNLKIIAASAYPQNMGADYLRPGRFGVKIPLSQLVDVDARRTVMDELFTQYRNEVGAIKASAFPDELIDRLPVVNKAELEKVVKAAIAKKPKGQLVLTKNEFEAALQEVKFTGNRGSLENLKKAYYNKIFFTSEDAFHLLPEYVRKIPQDEFVEAKNLFISAGRQPSWPLPTWIDGIGNKSYVKAKNGSVDELDEITEQIKKEQATQRSSKKTTPPKKKKNK